MRAAAYGGQRKPSFSTHRCGRSSTVRSAPSRNSISAGTAAERSIAEPEGDHFHRTGPTAGMNLPTLEPIEYTEAFPAKFALRHHWSVQQSGPGDSRSSLNVLKRRNERLVAEELRHARPLTPAGLTDASGSVAVRLSPAELPSRAENGDDRVVTSLRGAGRYVSQVCAGVVNGFKPARIMLGGELGYRPTAPVAGVHDGLSLAEVLGAVAVVLRGDRVSAAVLGPGR